MRKNGIRVARRGLGYLYNHPWKPRLQQLIPRHFYRLPPGIENYGLQYSMPVGKSVPNRSFANSYTRSFNFYLPL